MPTYTVKPSGGDYTSLSAAEAAQNGDHVTAAAITTIECYGMTDTTYVRIFGGTESADYYFNVVTAGDGVHEGKWTDSAYILKVATDPNCMRIDDWYVRITGVQFEQNYSSAGVVDAVLIQLARNVTFNKCIAKPSSTLVGSPRSGFFNNDGYSVHIYNSLVYDWGPGATTGGYYFTGPGTNNVVLNCGAHNCERGFYAPLGTHTSSNCWVQDSTSTASWSVGWNGNNNLSGDSAKGSMPGAASVWNKTLTFRDEANDDFHLVASDTDAIEKAFSSVLITEDIDGGSRDPTTPDIGPDEFTPAVSADGNHFITMLRAVGAAGVS